MTYHTHTTTHTHTHTHTHTQPHTHTHTHTHTHAHTHTHTHTHLANRRAEPCARRPAWARPGRNGATRAGRRRPLEHRSAESKRCNTSLLPPRRSGVFARRATTARVTRTSAGPRRRHRAGPRREAPGRAKKKATGPDQGERYRAGPRRKIPGRAEEKITGPGRGEKITGPKRKVPGPAEEKGGRRCAMVGSIRARTGVVCVCVWSGLYYQDDIYFTILLYNYIYICLCLYYQDI